ncbi:MAG TPA: ISLre2 family transposase [Bacillota bacterium]|nr:ISLre2 family transposase [Bacillota bacterium]
MDILQQMFQFSFKDLEIFLFKELRKAFGDILKEMLLKEDKRIKESRDKKRFKVVNSRKVTVATLFGDVTFERTYYKDCETGRYVHLLDEVLGLDGGISPCLAAIAAVEAVIGPSYRAACKSLEELYGHQVISHETVRQLVLKTGKQIGSEEKRRRQKPEGKKKVPIIFIEADGCFLHMQRQNKRNQELKVMIAHEGWENRTPGSKEYELLNKTYYASFDSEEFWDEASRQLYCEYDIDDDTIVVINGDRAPWIREGVEYFPKAMYQVDRFHVKKDLKYFLGDTEELSACLSAFDASDVDLLIRSLASAVPKIKDKQRSKGAARLLEDIVKMPDSFRDYRERRKDEDYDASQIRGMGSAESNMKPIANRLKKRGQSWSPIGATAMTQSLIKYWEGSLGRYAEHVGKMRGILDSEKIQEKIKDVSKDIVDKVLRVKEGRIPMKGAGTTQSGGLSSLFNRLDYADWLIT